MINQKELLHETIKTYESITAVWHLIGSWLEDINWHNEHARLFELMPANISQSIDDLEMQSYARYPSDYCESYIESIKDTPEYKMAKHKASYNTDSLYEFHKASRDYSFLSRIFGWGIRSTDWESKGDGKTFVNELYDMIQVETKRIEQLNEEKEATRRAYARMND